MVSGESIWSFRFDRALLISAGFCAMRCHATSTACKTRILYTGTKPREIWVKEPTIEDNHFPFIIFDFSFFICFHYKAQQQPNAIHEITLSFVLFRGLKKFRIQTNEK